MGHLICSLCKESVKTSLFNSKYHICPNHGTITKVEEWFLPDFWWQIDPERVMFDKEYLLHRWKLHHELVARNRCGYMREDGFCGYPNGEKVEFRFVDELCYTCWEYNDPANLDGVRSWILRYLQDHPKSSVQNLLNESPNGNHDFTAKALMDLYKKGILIQGGI